MADDEKPKKQYINAHTHIFTKNHVPKYIGRGILPDPLWRMASTGRIINVVRLVFPRYNDPIARFMRFWKGWRNRIRTLVYHHAALRSLIFLINFLLSLLVLIIILDLAFSYYGIEWPWFTAIRNVIEANFFPGFFSHSIRYWILLIAFLTFRSVRKIIFSILDYFLKLPGPRTMDLLYRMMNIGIYADYAQQMDVFNKLMDNYPEHTKFVVLPMDMEYMGAGKANFSYEQQMEDLKNIKRNQKFSDIFIPFVFAEPRRADDEPGYIDYNLDLLENHDFAGVKMYPALGYYPFDKNLLRLFHYAQEHDLPIMTHCIMGSVYYRGRKKPEWDYHPVLTFRTHHEEKPLPLYGYDNYEFSAQFTHPLNYECLLDPQLFRRLLDTYRDDQLNELFGYDPDSGTPPAQNLSRLKICFAHFGGVSEWYRFMNNDRSDFENRFLTDPHATFELHPGTTQTLWNNTSWYALIRNMFNKYENTYADISYILHDNRMFPILRDLLNIDGIKERILFGSDFYVVRQKETDKQMWVELKSALTRAEFELITVDNPRRYLNL